MTSHSQPGLLSRPHQTISRTARRRVTPEDILAVLLYPVYVLVAVAAIVYWIVAAVLRGEEPD